MFKSWEEGTFRGDSSVKLFLPLLKRVYFEGKEFDPLYSVASRGGHLPT